MSDSKAITINSSGELVEALVDDLVDKANINLTAAATVDLYSVTSNTIHISGSGAITSFGTPPRGGARRLVQFTSTGITLTHGTGAGTILLPGLANIVTTLGDYAEFISIASGAWQCTSYTKLDGTAVVSSGAPVSHVGEGGSAHSLVTTDTAGFMSAADKVKLNALYTTVYDTVDVDKSNSTATSVVVMAVSLEANAIYEVDCFLPFTSAAAATGIAIGFQGSVAGNYNLEVVVPITNTAVASQLRKIFPNSAETTTGEVLGTAVSAVNVVQTARISGTVKIGGTPGTLSIRYRSETAGIAVTIKSGATLIARRVA